MSDSTGRHASLIAAGILLSRLFGLVRVRVFSHYFGLQTDAADAFNAALRIPNFLQNLFGEGVLSASFIPVYARLLARKEEEEARRVAGAVAALLGLLTSVLVLAGMLATPWLIDVIAPGFEGAKRELTIRLVRILFPGVGLLVLSAWCLGILNSHRRFLLSYTAPVVWNVAMIATLVAFGGRTSLGQLAERLAWGAVLGSVLQVLYQLPAVLRLAGRLRLSLGRGSGYVKTVVHNFFPVFVGRGVVQISAYVDAILASLLPTGALTGVTNAQIIYLLPVSLFGMSVSAAELPAMSSALGSEEEVARQLRTRLDSGLRRIAFLVVPSAVAFFAFGDIIAGALFQTGRFTYADAVYVWAILAGAGAGLLASTLGRLYSSSYYALHDTRSPLRFATVRVALATGLGYFAALHLPGLIGLEARWGAAGITAAASVAAWAEFTLLRRGMNRRIGRTGLSVPFALMLWAAAGAGAAAGWALKLAFAGYHPVIMAGLVLGPYGLIYLALAALFKMPELDAIRRRLTRSGSRASRE